jgi:serine protease inhibitor
VLALASTIYFTASWENEFPQYSTKDAIFHSPEGDRAVPFMYRKMRNMYYWGENFTAVHLALTGDNYMWLILPDEGYTVNDVLQSEEYLQMTLDPVDWENQSQYEIKLSLPKFDIVHQQDLIGGMKSLGLSDVFDYTRADFSPITDTWPLYVGKIDHAARVSIDEKGCFGAGFTVIDVPMGSAPPKEVETIDFTLDRPFAFVVSSRDNLPLFAGVVNEP